MKFTLEFIQQYGMTILYAALVAIAGFLGGCVKRIYERATADDTKRKVVETCCKAVEQLYHDLDGEEKKKKAIEGIRQMLEVKGISIADIEIEMLIESTVAEFNYNFKPEDETIVQDSGA